MGRLLSVSTDLINGQCIDDGWNDYIKSFIGRGTETIPHQSTFRSADRLKFKGLIEYGDIGEMGISRVVSSPGRYIRNLSGPASLEAPSMIIVQIRGTGHLEQNGKRTQLVPGNWSIYDTTRPFSIATVCETECLIFTYKFNNKVIQRPVLEQMSNRCFGREGVEKVARDLMVSVFQEYPRLQGITGDASVKAIASLVETVLGEAANVPYEWHENCFKERIYAYIEENLRDEGLTVSTIADALGYSTRQIHRLFKSEAGETVAEYIWKRRLQRCFDEIRSGTSTNRTITEVAFAWGFSSSAHFSRAFKMAYGVSPRECRAIRSRSDLLNSERMPEH